MLNKLQLRIGSEEFDENNKLLLEKMRDYNFSRVGTYGKKEPLFLGCYDTNNELVAGLSAGLRWGMFFIDLLWVSENYRHKKLGSKLLAEAEKQAILKNEIYIRVNTATFQALDFYLKNGFEVFAKLPIFVEGHKDQYDYYLVKYLHTSPNSHCLHT
ncbi:MAG: acetyltransferase, GNAT family [uncultured bacterium]|nr:MAG: acetyltransferase, GNAT family [uncultured bacterium]